MVIFADLELNGMSGADLADIPPPLPLKGSMADYGNLTESQDLISPTTSPPAHQRVSHRDNDFLPFSLLSFFYQLTKCNSMNRRQQFLQLQTAGVGRSNVAHWG